MHLAKNKMKNLLMVIKLKMRYKKYHVKGALIMTKIIKSLMLKRKHLVVIKVKLKVKMGTKMIMMIKILPQETTRRSRPVVKLEWK